MCVINAFDLLVVIFYQVSVCIVKVFNIFERAIIAKAVTLEI